jgi:translocation and assembly module TamA
MSAIPSFKRFPSADIVLKRIISLPCYGRARHATTFVATFLLLALTLLPIQGRAQTAATHSYTVSISGAGGLTPMLNDNLEISRRRSSGELSDDEIRRLAGSAPNQIRSLLATEGYFSPQVTQELDQQGTSWTARFVVDLGPRTLVESVDITFKGAIVQTNPERVERLRRRWGLPTGGIFQQKAWDDAKNNLLKALLVRDYPAAAITQSEARIEPATNSAILTVEIDSGPAFTFGELQITGLQRYASRIVTDLNPIKPGEPYSQEKLNELQARVQDTGYFRSAFATVEIDPAHPLNVPIRLDLNENERKRLSLGLGFSTDSGARGQIKWLDRNFLGRDWRLESNLLVDRDNRLLGAEVFLPPLRNDWRPSFGTRYEYTNSAGEMNDKTATAARLTSPDKNDEMIWATTLYTDHQRIVDSDYSNHREAVVGSFTYTRRRVNDLISPTRGYVASIDLGAGPTGDGDSLARAVGRVTYLSPYYKRWQAVLRGQVGQVSGAGRESVPADLLFRTGGDQTVRGYGYEKLGVEQDGAIVGGTVTAVFSAEMVYRITPQWGAAIFHDAGNAADTWKNFHFAQGSGVGARWRSPIGPVNLDLAYGHDTHDVRLHFSIGYGF